MSYVRARGGWEGAGSLGTGVAQVLGATAWVLGTNPKFLGVQGVAAVEPLIPAFGQWRQGDLSLRPALQHGLEQGSSMHNAARQSPAPHKKES